MRSLAVGVVLFLAPAAVDAEEPWEPVFRAGDLRIRATGYVQLDLRAYPNWETVEDFRSDAFEFRRARFGAEGDFHRLSFELDFDPADPAGNYLKDAYAEIEIAKELRVRGGHFKLPFSPEYLRSPAKTDFVERPVPVDALSPSRDLGVMLHGELFERVLYEAGIFAGDGRTRLNRAGPTAAGRLAVEALDGFIFGLSFTRGRVDAVPEDRDDIEPLGFAGRSPAGFEFFAPHFIEGRRHRLDAEVELVRGPVALRAELLQGSEERHRQGPLFDDLPGIGMKGWFVSGTWLVTGEKKRRTIRPDDSFPGGAGAIEIGVRVESIRFDDAGSDSSFESAGDRARNVRPADDFVLTGGISWWPSRWIRLMTNVAVERYQDSLLAPEPGRKGNYVSILSRFQFLLP
jgi:phosphate-selective porin